MSIEDIEFIRDHAKAGIYHNYPKDPNAHMNRLNSIIRQLIVYSRSNGLFKEDKYKDICELSSRIFFLYGDSDWMKRELGLDYERFKNHIGL